MRREYVMGNASIAFGALAAGVNVVSGYPGTPSSEIVETISKHAPEGVHVEWSANEKAAMEVAAGAAYTGARVLVTMKQMGLNVAADALMSVSYIGVKGGMVVVAADDPGPISSQTEQDTRLFSEFARIPVFDPVSPEDAYQMIQDAFACSEKYGTPVLFRPTTRVCHAYASIEVPEKFTPKTYEGFIKDTARWVIFPRLAHMNHGKIEARNPKIGEEFSDYAGNTIELFGENPGEAEKAIFASGISYAYAKEALKQLSDDTGLPGVELVRIATAHPLPERFVLNALEGVKEVLVYEELSPYVESALLKTAGKHHLPVNVFGKLTNHVTPNGENSADAALEIISSFLGFQPEKPGIDLSDMPALPARPPVLCAGCPHRAAFYAVKQAMKGKKTVYCGDIGCYTLGNAQPLDMTDTCLCMGACITMAQGFHWAEPDTVCFAFVGDSTFFASGMAGVVNAVYNEADIILCVLDNSTTAMTGHQPHPGTGRTMMGNVVEKASIEKILEASGVKKCIIVDPLDYAASVEAVKVCETIRGVKAIIFRAPCIALVKPKGKAQIAENCIQCRKCIREIGCPALIIKDEKVAVDEGQCTGCGLCNYVCPVSALSISNFGTPMKTSGSTVPAGMADSSDMKGGNAHE